MELVRVPEQLVLVNGGALLKVLLSVGLRRSVWHSDPCHPTPQCHSAHQLSFGVFFISVLCMFSDDCLRSERFLQLPGLAGRGQQCSHQSDGWRLRLGHLCHGPPWGRRLQLGHSTGRPASPRPEPFVESAWKGLRLLRSAPQTRAHPALLRNRDPSSGLAQVGKRLGWREAHG